MSRSSLGCRALLIASVSIPFAASGLAGERVVLEPVRDATMIEHPAGAFADGAGTQLRAGRTGQPNGSIRRALLEFDLAASVPRNATITDVALVLRMSGSQPGAYPLSLHRLLREWSEGPSATSGGQGVPSAPGDVTWIHREFDQVAWDTPGGDYAVAPSAVTLVDGVATYAWRESGMIDDVQLWVERPRRNHGWILLGGEDVSQSAKRFDSRETPLPGLPPLLLIEFERPGRGDGSSDDSSSDSSSDDS